eukprot:GEZU01014750.1.p1 GENE.GEZU01014750.1~~GEZU01014750.1.p1  ORF type:complete len:277 (-),score=29.31 GEZU01014750.1:20-850(-)
MTASPSSRRIMVNKRSKLSHTFRSVVMHAVGVGLFFLAAYLLLLCLFPCEVTRWQESKLAVATEGESIQSSDAIIVLGYSVTSDALPTPRLVERLETALRLYNSGVAKHIIVSGGYPRGKNFSEASVMAKWLLDRLPPPSPTTEELLDPPHDVDVGAGVVILEEKSTSTRENAVFSLEIAQQRNWKRLVVVTNHFHQLRSRLAFEKCIKEITPDHKGAVEDSWMVTMASISTTGIDSSDLQCDPSSISFREILRREHDFIRELAAFALYTVRGWLF